MPLDRDAARALFDNAAPMPAGAGGAAFASASPFAPAANDALTARMSGGSTRKSIDWRLAAPVGVAALCAGAALLIVSQRDPAEPGKTVATTEVTRPLPTPLPAPTPLPEQVETATAAPPASSIAAPPAARSTPVVRARVTPAPARRAPPPRTVAAAPSASDASSNVSAREPYVPPPSLGAPVSVIPAAPPPVMTPDPAPVTPQP
jgi:WAS/WASL-interacting protein